MGRWRWWGERAGSARRRDSALTCDTSRHGTNFAAPVSIASDVLKEHVHTDANINRFIMTVGVALAFEGECSRRRWRVSVSAFQSFGWIGGQMAITNVIADSEQTCIAHRRVHGVVGHWGGQLYGFVLELRTGCPGGGVAGKRW